MAEERGIDPDDLAGQDRNGELCEAGWRRALERWGERGCFGCVSNSQDRKERSNAERSDESDEEDGQKRQPVLLAGSVAGWGTSRTITAIAIAAIAIQYQARFGWKAFIAGGRSIARSGNERDKADEGTMGDTTGGVFRNLS